VAVQSIDLLTFWDGFMHGFNKINDKKSGSSTVLKDFPDCGKRFEKSPLEPQYAECMWDCEGLHAKYYTPHY